MGTLTVWRYDTPTGAKEASAVVQRLARERILTVHDAAVVSWEEGRRKPKTEQLFNTAAAGALSGTFWGLLFGLIFFMPLIGAAVGAATGALAGSLNDVGINDTFINKVRDEVIPGTSALFVLASDVVVDKLRAAFEGETMGELIFTNLSDEQEAALREVFVD
ncbi:DUF1269 domain-containing protein [Nocardioides sp. GXZ039]|uniref:DUF1269 domain-containing protein n=1 Tax=Nocardioides sp. GXZ039 TaxID=3136018 RepID=UPI0030F3C4FD